MTGSSLTFVSKAAIDGGLAAALKVQKTLVAVEHTRDIGKKDLIHNGATPVIEVDPETYRVTADGEALVCDPAMELPMAQRYFLFLGVGVFRPSRHLQGQQRAREPVQSV